MHAARKFVDFLYDVCPVWPDNAPREQLLTLYEGYLDTPEEEPRPLYDPDAHHTTLPENVIPLRSR